MEYTYTVYEAVTDGVCRKDITTRLEEIDICHVTGPNFVEVSSNLKKDDITFLRCESDLIGWRETLARVNAWKPHKVANGKTANDAEKEVTERLDKAMINFITSKTTNVEGLPDANLKTQAAIGKPVVSSVPPIALLALGAAMQDGVNKYGRFNWRGTGVTATVFYDAIHRHLAAWYSGENYVPDSKVHHLAHIMASCAILLDAELHSVLNDDRDLKGHKVTPEEMHIIKQ